MTTSQELATDIADATEDSVAPTPRPVPEQRYGRMSPDYYLG